VEIRYVRRSEFSDFSVRWRFDVWPRRAPQRCVSFRIRLDFPAESDGSPALAALIPDEMSPREALEALYRVKAEASRKDR
jgi:hypothetical protein